MLHDFFTELPIPVSDLANDVIIMANRASTAAQEDANDAKFAYMKATIGNVGKKVIKKAFTGSGRLKPIYDYNESHGLDHGYTNSWFGFLEDIIKEVQRPPYFPGQRITVLFLTPDRLARPQLFHPHYPQTWELTDTDCKQFEKWMTARFGRQRQYIRFLTCFAGTPNQCRGFQSKISMHHFGKHGGRPKGSRNKKPRVPTLTPKQKTALRKILHDEIPYLVNELKLNGTECYRYLKELYGIIPVIKRTVQRWVTAERGTPGKSGRPIAKITPPEPKNKCVILNCRRKRPIGIHPVLIRIKRIRSTGKLHPAKRVINVSFFPYFRIQFRKVYEPP